MSFWESLLPILSDNTKESKKHAMECLEVFPSYFEKRWLNEKFKQYGVLNRDLSTLKIRMDEIPVSLAIAQAAKETGWGTSRFALKGNALFGQWTWSGEGLKPKEAEKNEGHKVMKFNILQASVRAYQRNINTHSSYQDFRLARAKLRDLGESLDSMILSSFLDKYAETGKLYGWTVFLGFASIPFFVQLGILNLSNTIL